VSKYAEELANKLKTIHDNLRQSLVKAQEFQAKYYNIGHKPMEFKEGDYVWLAGKHIRTSRPKKKLDYKNFGPFKVTRVINTQAYQLKLPENWNIHDVFHVSLLEKYIPDVVSGRQQPMPHFVDIPELEQWHVEAILGQMEDKNGIIKYQVRWKGYGPEDDT